MIRKTPTVDNWSPAAPRKPSFSLKENHPSHQPDKEPGQEEMAMKVFLDENYATILKSTASLLIFPVWTKSEEKEQTVKDHFFYQSS